VRADRLFAYLAHATRSVWFALALVASSGAAADEVAYTGTLGKQPIRLFANVYSDGVVHGVYAYDRHDTPIRIDGRLVAGELVLDERDPANKIVATLHFAAFAEAQPELRGEWRAAPGTKRLPITLQRTWPPTSDVSAGEREVLQSGSTRDEYFTLVPDDSSESWNRRAVELRVLRKGTDQLLQSIELDTEWRGTNSVAVGDFNFDGVEDISVFEGSYAGANTSSRYFLRKGVKYVDSGWSGVSLEFDAETKLVREHNQCCAGTSHVITMFKVVDDRLVEVESTCLEWDEDKNDLVEVECGE